MFFAADGVNTSAETSQRGFTKSTVDNAPTIQVTTNPTVVNGSILTATTISSDDIELKRIAFAIINHSNNNTLDISNSIKVTNPANCSYNSSVSTWGYIPSSKTDTTQWQIDISGLSDGEYDIQFFAGDGNIATNSTKLFFSKKAPTIVVNSSASLSGSTLTATTTASDDYAVTRTSFGIYDSNDIQLNVKTTVNVTSPVGCTYSSTPNTWGYVPSSKTETAQWSIDVAGLPDGTYFIRFFAADGGQNTAQTSRMTFTKSSNNAPTLVVGNAPALAGTTLTATTTASDDNAVTRTSFVILDNNLAHQNIKTNVYVASPAGCTYASSPNSWGYTPTASPETANWSIDISGLPEGSYYIKFYATDGTNTVETTTYAFEKTGAPLYDFLAPDINGKKVGGRFFLDMAVPVSVGNPITTMYLEKAGVNVAYVNLPVIASDSLNNPENYLGRYVWKTISDNKPISTWSQILSETSPVSFKIIGKKKDGSLIVSSTFSIAIQTSLQSSISARDTNNQTINFPQNDPINTTFISTITGGTGPYTYRWINDRGLSVDENAYESTSSTCTTTVDDLFSRLVTLEVRDGAGNVSYAHFITFIDYGWETGNPALSGSGSTLFNGVDVSNRNFYMSSTDLSVGCKGIPFALSRSYNSAWGTISHGRVWRFNYDLKLQIPQDKGGRELQLYREDGREERYFRDTDGYWYGGRAGMFDRLIENDDGTYTLYTKGKLIYRFADPDNGGELLSLQDRDGNTMTITRNSATQKTVVDPAGRSYVLTYDAEGRLTKARDYSGRSVEYTYDVNGNLTDFKNVMGKTTRYEYITDGQLTAIKDPRSMASADPYNYLTITYDSTSRDVKYLTDVDGNETEYRVGTLDGKPATVVLRPSTNGVNNNVLFVFDGNGRVTQTITAQNYGDYKRAKEFKNATDSKRIAEKGLVTSVTNPRNYKNSFTYSDDGRGNRVSSTDPKNQTSAYSYLTENDFGASDIDRTNLNVIASTTSPADHTYAFTYTDSGNMKTIKTPITSDPATQISYYGDGQRNTVTDPAGHATKYTYNADGTVNTVTDAKNQTIRYTYDTLGRVETVTDRRGIVTRYTYNARGNALTVTSAYGTALQAVVTNTYDENNNLVSTRDARGNTRTYAFTRMNQMESETFVVSGMSYSRSYSHDELGRIWKITNENSHARQSEFDAGGRKVTEKDALNNTTTYTFDSNGNILTKTDAIGHVTTYTYDELDRMIKRKDHLNNTVEYTYDAEGHMASMKDPKGNVTRYEYDAAGRLSKVTDAANQITSATYDAAGNLKTLSGPAAGNRVTYSYDELNRMIRHTDAGNRNWNYTYDANSNMLTETTPDSKTTAWQYDELNRVTRITYPDSSVVQYEYDLNGNRTRMVDSTGTTTYTFDEVNRLTSVTDAFGKTVTYSYDGVGHVKSMVYPGGKQLSYSYDALERLESVDNWLGHTTEYSYNTIHQLTEVVNGNDTRTIYSFDTVNRLTGLQNLKDNDDVISSHNYTLDANGNVSQDNAVLPLQPSFASASKQMSFDAANRIISAGDTNYTHDLSGRIISETTGALTKTYTYNDQDLITEINGVVPFTNAYNGDGNRVSMNKNGKMTRYVLDVNETLPNVIAETNSSGGITAYYTYGNGLISRIDASTGKESYYHFDSTGNTIALTDENQELTDSYFYTPYGEIISNGSTDNPFRYSGRHGVMDDGNGLNYMRARYYNPEIKRFMSMDVLTGTLGEPQSLNRYAYVNGNPIIGIDPSGLKTDKFDKWIKEQYNLCNSEKGGLCRMTGAVLYQFSNNITDTSNDLYDDLTRINNEYQNGNMSFALMSSEVIATYTYNLGTAGLDSINPYPYMQEVTKSIIYILEVDEETKEILYKINEAIYFILSVRKFFSETKDLISQIESSNKKAVYAKKMVAALIKKQGNNATVGNCKTLFDMWVQEISAYGNVLEYSVSKGAELTVDLQSNLRDLKTLLEN
ncbi:MAG: RHS repeat-associated core domain-containing protein [Desulfobacteraceae bacterium]